MAFDLENAVIDAAKQVRFQMRNMKYPLALDGPQLVWLRKAVDNLIASEPHDWQPYSTLTLEHTDVSPGACVVCGRHVLSHSGRPGGTDG